MFFPFKNKVHRVKQIIKQLKLSRLEINVLLVHSFNREVHDSSTGWIYPASTVISSTKLILDSCLFFSLFSKYMSSLGTIC